MPVDAGSWVRFEHEFLIKLAPIWLACRWRVMGHKLRGKAWPKQDLRNDLLGCTDYAAEMREICKLTNNS